VIDHIPERFTHTHTHADQTSPIPTTLNDDNTSNKAKKDAEEKLGEVQELQANRKS
jgi:hypothetical protein